MTALPNAVLAGISGVILILMIAGAILLGLAAKHLIVHGLSAIGRRVRR